jgi:flagellar biosynthetic protein FliS
MANHNSPTAAAQYRRMQISTASREKAVCMLHEKCVQLLRQALHSHEMAQRRVLLNRAQDIVAQLQHALRTGDQVGQSIFLLYDYCYCLCESTDDAQVQYALDIFEPLAETLLYLWRHP